MPREICLRSCVCEKLGGFQHNDEHHQSQGFHLSPPTIIQPTPQKLLHNTVTSKSDGPDP